MTRSVARSHRLVWHTCRWCGEKKHVSEFPRSQAGWVLNECTACRDERLGCWAAVEASPVADRGARTMDAAGPLICTRCGRWRPLAAFYIYADGAHRHYYRPKCKQCTGAEQNLQPQRYRDTEKRRRRERNRWLLKKYGITLQEYEALLVAQDGRCAICGTDKPGGPTPTASFHVDHEHATDKVRALLCFGCNTGIGAFGEDVARILAAADYLTKWAERCPPERGAAAERTVPGTRGGRTAP